MDEPLDEHPSGRAALRDPAIVLTAVLCAAVVASGAVASAKGWIPTGDDAFLSLRTRHVFGRHPILLNNASSAGPSAGSQYNHPGAFPLTLLSPVTLIGGPGSLALATALVNAGWIALVSVMVRRIAGARAQLGAVGVAAVLAGSMGATLLIDPWNPDYGIWPVAALVVAAWGVRRRHHRMMAVVVLAASVAFQTHLSLTVLSVAVAGWALAGLAVHWYRTGDSIEDRRVLVPSIVVATVVGIVANAQMLADQLFRTGNLSKIVEGTGFKEATVTARQAGSVLASKLAIPPWWFRGSWTRPVLLADVPSAGATAAGLLIVAVLTAAAVWSVRRRVPALSSLFGVLGVAAVAATAISTRYPLRVGLPLPYFRWVWPLAAVWTAAVIAAVIATAFRFVAGRLPSSVRRALLAALAAALLIAGFVPSNGDVSPNPEWAQDISRTFSAAAVRETKGLGPIVVDQSIQEAALWVIPALMDQLDAAGIDVRAHDAVLIQQTDRVYAAGGGERWHLAVRGGLQVDDAPDHSRRIAVSRPISAADELELERLTSELAPALTAPGAVTLTAIGTAETDAADLRHLTTGELPPAELLQSVPFHQALLRGAIAVRGVDQRDLRRASQLGSLVGGRSIALYLVDTRPG